jgi:hypothetical protein
MKRFRRVYAGIRANSWATVPGSPLAGAARGADAPLVEAGGESPEATHRRHVSSRAWCISRKMTKKLGFNAICVS